MVKSKKITSRQIILLMTISRIANILTFMPIIHMGPANQDIWIMIIISCFYTLLLGTPILFLSNKFNELTMIGFMEKIFGKVLGKVIGISYAMFFTGVSIVFSYIAIQMIISSLLVDTAPILIILVLILSCLYISLKGLEVIGRSAEIFAPIILTLFTIFIFLGYSNIDLSVLLPIYKDSTFLSINMGAMQMALIFTDIYLLVMVVPELENRKEINGIFIKSIFYSFLFIFTIVVAVQSSLGVEQARHSNFPFLTFVRRIRSYSIFQRIESIYIIIWILAIVSRISNYIYISNQAFKEVFNNKEGNLSLYIIGAIIAIMTYYITEIHPVMELLLEVKPQEYIYYLVFKTIIPLISLIVYLFRRKSFEGQKGLGN